MRFFLAARPIPYSGGGNKSAARAMAAILLLRPPPVTTSFPAKKESGEEENENKRRGRGAWGIFSAPPTHPSLSPISLSMQFHLSFFLFAQMCGRLGDRFSPPFSLPGTIIYLPTVEPLFFGDRRGGGGGGGVLGRSAHMPHFEDALIRGEVGGKKVST